MRTKEEFSYANLLRTHGYRATPGRIALLSYLEDMKRPVSVHEAAKTLRRKLDTANTYRALEAFVRSGFVRRVDLRHTHAHYELTLAPHHHHAICTDCGTVEEIAACPPQIERTILQQAKRFSELRDHAFEFFGLCTACALTT